MALSYNWTAWEGWRLLRRKDTVKKEGQFRDVGRDEKKWADRMEQNYSFPASFSPPVWINLHFIQRDLTKPKLTFQEPPKSLLDPVVFSNQNAKSEKRQN